jgi:hypothetical protein
VKKIHSKTPSNSKRQISIAENKKGEPKINRIKAHGKAEEERERMNAHCKSSDAREAHTCSRPTLVLAHRTHGIPKSA